MSEQLTQNQIDSYWMPFTANRQFKKIGIITGAEAVILLMRTAVRFLRRALRTLDLWFGPQRAGDI